MTPGAENLRAYFQPNRMSQAEIAKRLGVTQQAVSSWVSGRTRPPAHHRKALQQLVGVAEDDWLTDEERQQVEAATSSPTKGAA